MSVDDLSRRVAALHSPPTTVPEWSLPSPVRALQTGRGIAAGIGDDRPLDGFAGFNLGDHVGDDPDRVKAHRQRLSASIGAVRIPWLSQVHGTNVLVADRETPAGVRADAVVTAETGVACAVLTADCLPVLLVCEDGSVVGAAHAGWRGLYAGVLEAAVAAMQALGDSSQRIHAWLGPAIGPAAFEVGPEVRDAFLAQDPHAFTAFHPGRGDRWHADLQRLAGLRLRRIGVARIEGEVDCTYAQPQRYYSYRRDGVTGRQASLIWRTA